MAKADSNGNLISEYLYDTAGRMVTELDSNFNPKRREVYAGGRHLGTYTGAGGLVPSTGSTTAPMYYSLTDWIGTERMRTDGTGAPCQTSTSQPYGDNQQTNGTCSPSPNFFTGKERDSESGLDYFGARYYGSSMGRFTSPDLAGPDLSNPQSLNMYRYAFNNPLRYTDPNGLYERDVHFDLTQVLAYAAGYSASQSLRIAGSDQGVDDSNATGPFVGYSARRDYHFTTQERRAEMWDYAGTEEGLGVYLHAEQDSFSHDGFGPSMGHLLAGHAPDKTYTDPTKADSMANNTYSALQQAGINIGTEAGAVPYADILPFIQGFNRAKKKQDKDSQLNQLRQYVIQYRKDHKDDKKNKGPGMPGGCPAEFSHCG